MTTTPTPAPAPEITKPAKPINYLKSGFTDEPTTLVKGAIYRTFEAFQDAVTHAFNDSGMDHEYVANEVGDAKLMVVSIRCPYGRRSPQRIIAAWNGRAGEVFFVL